MHLHHAHNTPCPIKVTQPAGIENFSRHIAGRAAGSPPECLLDYFPSGAASWRQIEEQKKNQSVTEEELSTDWLLMVDESHVTIPQVPRANCFQEFLL